MKRTVDVLYGLKGYPNAARFAEFHTDFFANNVVESVITTKVPPAYTAGESMGVGTYSTPVVDTSLLDVNAFVVNLSTATNKTSADTSTLAAFIGCRNTANTTHNKLQALLCSTTVQGNCYDAYAVQGHLAITSDCVTHDATGNICAASFKVSINAEVTGTVECLLLTLDDDSAAQTVTGTLSMFVMDIGRACTNAIEFYSNSNLTNLFSFASVAGCLGAADVAGKETPSDGGMGADGHITISVGGVPYYIPIYNSLTA
jgi:hypothetical protein